MPRAGRVQDRGFWLACTECRNRNYTTVKNRRNDPDRLSLKKYCPSCRHHTEHRETGIQSRGRR